MSKFCYKCGTRLNEKSKFCPKCGTAVRRKEQSAPAVETTSAEHICAFCGAKLKPTSKFCFVCGKAVQTARPEPQPQVRQQTQPQVQQQTQQQTQQQSFKEKAAIAQTAEKIVSQSFYAPDRAGEFVLGKVGVSGILPPGDLMLSRILEIPKNFISFFKDPKKLIPVIITASIWLLTYVLRAAGASSSLTRALSFISFSGWRPSNFGSLPGFIVGRGVFAGAVISLVSLIFSKSKNNQLQGNQAEKKRSFGELLKDCFGVNADSVWGYLLGIGAAFLFFLFFSNGGGSTSMLGAVSAAFLSARAAASNGFFKQLISSFASKLGSKKPQIGQSGKSQLEGILRGMTTGFSGAAVICLMPYLFARYTLLFGGLLLLLGGGTMTVLALVGVINSRTKEAAV